MEMEKSLYTKYRMQFESEQENVDRMHYNSVQTMKKRYRLLSKRIVVRYIKMFLQVSSFF